MADLSITPASPTRAIVPIRFPELRPSAETFGATLTRAVDDVGAAQLKAQDMAVAVAAGQGVDTAQGIVAIEKANIAFQFALQIRNKLLEAYQQIMQMSV